MRTGYIFDVKRYAIHDGPGIRTTVFLKGCPLKCSWCHNPESVQPAPEQSVSADKCVGCGDCAKACTNGALSQTSGRLTFDPTRCTTCGECVDACSTGARRIVGRWISVNEVMAEIERDVIFFDESGGGVTFSGGEPLAQPDFLEALLERCANAHIHTAVDTSLHANWAVVEKIACHTDLFLCDIKHMDAKAHTRFTGVSNERILKNLQKLAGLRKRTIIRVPVIPGANDGDENINALGHFVSVLGEIDQVDLLPYHRAGEGKLARLQNTAEPPEFPAVDQDRLAAIAARLMGFGLSVRIGG